jgi:hypothetical protein
MHEQKFYSHEFRDNRSEVLELALCALDSLRLIGDGLGIASPAPPNEFLSKR